MEKITEVEAIKQNAIRLADHHRDHCDGATCNISLECLLRLLERAGIPVTIEEKRRFF